MKVKQVASYAEFLALEDKWGLLWGSVAADNVFLHFDWFRSFIEAFELHDQLYILVCSEGEHINAILPLRRLEEGDLQSLGVPRSDYVDLICASDQVANVVGEIFDFLFEQPGWRRLEIRELSERSLLYQYCHGNKGLGWRTNWRLASTCPGIEFSQDGLTLDALVRKQSLRRREIGLAKMGGVEFRSLTDWADIQPLLGVFYDLHIARWKMADVESQYLKDQEREFCNLYTKRFLDAGLLHFSVLYCDAIVMAIHIGFVTDSVYVWYKPCFNIEYKKLSPGEVLIKRLLEHCGSIGVGYFDFTRGAEQFKKRFSNRSYSNYDLIVFARKRDQMTYDIRAKLKHLNGRVSHQSGRVVRLARRMIAFVK